MSKFYVSSGTIRWVIGFCDSPHRAATLFVCAFKSRAIELTDEITVAQRGFRSQYARDATVYDLGEIIRELRAEREKRSGEA